MRKGMPAEGIPFLWYDIILLFESNNPCQFAVEIERFFFLVHLVSLTIYEICYSDIIDRFRNTTFRIFDIRPVQFQSVSLAAHICHDTVVDIRRRVSLRITLVIGDGSIFHVRLHKVVNTTFRFVLPVARRDRHGTRYSQYDRIYSFHLVTSCYEDTFDSRFARDHVRTRSLFEVERHATYCSLRILLDLSFSLGSAVPVAEEEPAIRYALLEFIVIITFEDMSVTESLGFIEDIILDIIKQFLHLFYNTIHGERLFLERIAAHHLDCTVFKVTATHAQTYRYTFQLIIGKLETGTFVVSIIIFYRDTQRPQTIDDRSQSFSDGVQLLLTL